MFLIEDGREQFYQWDNDRRLIIEDSTITEVHFCNRTDNCSLVVDVYVEGDKFFANVPNILLQTDWDIRVYGFDGNYTKHCETFKVVARTQPADYVYTETEVRSYKEYNERLTKVEETTAKVEAQANETASKTKALEKTVANATYSKACYIGLHWNEETKTRRGMRLGYRSTPTGSAKKWIVGSGQPTQFFDITQSWQIYEFHFTIEEEQPFYPVFYGGFNTTDITPYDFKNVKVYKVDAMGEKSEEIYMNEDIEEQWWTIEDQPDKNKKCLLTYNGGKFIHMYKQSLNTVYVGATYRGDTEAPILKAGDYVIEFLMRATPWSYWQEVEVPTAHSERLLTVIPDSYGSLQTWTNYSIRCGGFGTERVIFYADTKSPHACWVNVKVEDTAGEQGLIYQLMLR